MDTEQLMAALTDSGHAPEPATVLASLQHKRQARTRRRYAMAGCAAAAVVIAALAVALPRFTQGSATESSADGSAAAGSAMRNRPLSSGAALAPSEGPARAGTASSSPRGFSGLAAACTAVPLSQRLADTVAAGGSVVVADATAAGPAAGGQERVALRDVQTLRGPRIAAALTAYTVTGSAHGGLHGQVFAIVLPAGTAGTTAGHDVLAAPVAGGTVQFADAGCWGTGNMSLAAAEQLAAGK